MVNITKNDMDLIKQALGKDNVSMVDHLTVDGSRITYDAGGFSMPARSIAYIK